MQHHYLLIIGLSSKTFHDFTRDTYYLFAKCEGYRPEARGYVIYINPSLQVDNWLKFHFGEVFIVINSQRTFSIQIYCSHIPMIKCQTTVFEICSLTSLFK
jgi:hypothetical protein